MNPGELPLLDFVPALNARYERPEHLVELAELFERLEREPVRALVSLPPQHGKSDLIVNGVARLVRRRPWLRNAYACYGQTLVAKKARQCRDTAIAAGVTLRDDSHAVLDWQTVEGGGLFSTSVGSGLTGNPVDGVLIVDDPHKDREDAESALARERVHDWWSSTAKARVHPTASVIICHTRWHQDDLIGRLSKETKPDGSPAWTIINKPAINDRGEPLWHLRPLEFLEEQRRGNEYDWWSLWMGSPRPRGTSVFRGVKFYTELPKQFRVGKGVDFAATAKTRADYSAAVVLLAARGPWTNPRTNKEEIGDLFYVVDVRRAQCEAPDFLPDLRAIDASYKGSYRWDVAGSEKAAAQLLPKLGIKVHGVLATADKFVRSQPVATAWNEGRVLVPQDAPWLKAFVDELGLFTGVSDRHDDQVDAFASAFATVGRRQEGQPPPNVEGRVPFEERTLHEPF